MHYDRGSEWRKWDFHVHTPYSILNNNYGFDPFYLEAQKDKDPSNKELEVAFDGYVKELFTRAVDAGVAAIGITDYFMIEGYKRIRNDYLDKPDKMRELFPDQNLYEKVRQIYIFPNIELRVDTFVGEGAHSVNYHVIFSDEVSIQDIEENFLGALSFKMNGDDQKSLTRHNIESLGKALIEDNGVSGTPLVAGLNHVTVSYADIKNVLVRSKIFAGKFIITVPVDEDLSKVKWSGRDYPTRKNIYIQCHCFLTSNKRTIDWALGKDDEEGRKKEFGALKPCIWGSDAHEYERMFNPANDRHCWIKADTTFEGLQQILYEPAERVCIQDKRPFNRDPHQIISSIQFEDDNFQTTPVYFNDFLTCIIGGKSTGKSLLLEQLARTIDSDLVEEQNKLVSSKRKPFSVKKTIVTWKDGTTDSRKIVYIPQTYLNRSIDNPEEKTAINRIVESVLMQQPQISIGFSALETTKKTICSKLKSDIAEFCTLVRRRAEIIEKIKETGAPEVFQQTIKELEDEREALANRIDIQQDEIDEFGELEVNMAELLSSLQSLFGENENIVTMESPSVIFPEYFESRYDKTISHDFNEDFPCTHAELDGILASLNNTVHSAWDAYKKDLIKLVKTQIDELNHKKNECTTRYETLKEKVTQNEQLSALTARINREREGLARANEYVCQKAQIDEKLSTLRESIILVRAKLHDAYQKFCQIVNDTSAGDETNLKFSAYPVWKLKDFQGGLSNILDNRNYISFRNYHKFDLADLKSEDYTEKFLEALWIAITDKNDLGSLAIKVGNTLESALTFIFKDWYNIYYEVKSGNDTIEEMSPGKKALVLLELLINLEDSRCPILIDQPEDDLDNRSIYNDLVQFIRAKKKERQIIIVTHNANVLLGADAEEVIIANQDGQNTRNMSKRFEYRSGAIENNQIPMDDKGSMLPGILNASGLQTQICDILEGGRLAFELRQNKYRSIAQDA